MGILWNQYKHKLILIRYDIIHSNLIIDDLEIRIKIV